MCDKDTGQEAKSALTKTFTPSNITKWVSTIEHAWAGGRNTVITDPDHMAAVELVREIFHFDNSVRNKQKREALHQQANALLADMTEAPARR